MTPGMIKLEAPRHAHGEIVVGWAPPYARSGYSKVTHRVRSGVTIVRKGVTQHVALTAYCGQTCFVTHTRKCAALSATLPEGATLCAFCEVKAVKRGQPPT